MKIVYTGPIDEVEVPYEEDGRPKVFTAARLQPTECPDELAAMLLEQRIWKRAGTAKPARTGT